MNRVHSLSEREIENLKQLYRETNDADVQSRCDMILLSNEGWSPPQVADRARFSRRTMTRYIKPYEAKGVDGLFTQVRAGRTPR